MELEAVHNDKFSVEAAETQLQKLLTSWLLATSGQSFSNSRADIAAIEEARRKALSMLNVTFDRMESSARYRRECLLKYAGVNFVSIGEDCFSRTVLTRWGLKPSAKFGERSMPFDLSVHQISSLANLLEQDFRGYTDPANLTYLEEKNFCSNVLYKVGFNHEVGREFAENNFERLREVYDRRLRNFRELLAHEDRKCFVLHVMQPRHANWSAVRRIWEWLRANSKGSVIMVCLCTWQYGQEITMAKREPVSVEGISLVDVNYPLPQYVWHKHVVKNEAEGFERSVIDDLRIVVDGWLAGLQKEDKQVAYSRVLSSDAVS
ncbi:DUF1796 family putative cysteine peptidase [Muricoccus pecuniae]|uniref:Papain-like cysteine peptidase n=1 Tax=Muricoccus pecuniae TaxID=693023 RepID=A0A840YCP2_9PROT|nr:DUF1796 family putative cysteine peptidase [Roseomonas pecuniae]MBB5692282.1 hypothetical protein [Roseomonas pecuniae]